MIEIKNLDKSFGNSKIISNLNMNIKKGSIYGLVGINGSGKTTIIKHLTGVLIPDSGEILYEGEPVFENKKIKEKIGYVPDEIFFYTSYTLSELSSFYASVYKNWNEERFSELINGFGLDRKTKLSRFSKGMQKQGFIALTLAKMPDYLILDEPIDGLDPIVRKVVWKFILDDVANRQMSVLVSTHNLREIEGICDSVGILSQGSMCLERDLDELKTDVYKVQIAYNNKPENPYKELNVLHKEERGSIDLIIVKNHKDFVYKVLESASPAVIDLLPLTLEEIFIYELGGLNNEISNTLF